jgi:hypothetical protein
MLLRFDLFSFIFWQTICDMDYAVDNINFPTDEAELMQLVDNWAARHKDHHGRYRAQLWQ